MNNAYDELVDYIDALWIIDTHEHLPPGEERRDRETDVLKEYLRHYFSSDLVSAGLKKEDLVKVTDIGRPLMERWMLAEPYWEAARNTGYGRALDIAAKGLYGVDRICRETIEELNARFLDSLKPGHFRRVLREKSRIATSLVVSDEDCDAGLFCRVFCVDRLVRPDFAVLAEVAAATGVKICSFPDWLEGCEAFLTLQMSSGAVALKSGLAYFRSIRYERTDYREAEEAFNGLLSQRSLSRWNAEIRPGPAFQDYMMHFILRFANSRSLAVQFHTGLQEGNGNQIGNSDPSLLTNLFLEYGDVSFDVFHIGYPYQHLLPALAKMFPNVYLDMCWAHIISPNASVSALTEWLDAVPANKISAFGGDYCFVDGVYGHQSMARQNVAKALAVKVGEGVFDMDWAKRVAQMLFYGNPARIFKLEPLAREESGE